MLTNKIVNQHFLCVYTKRALKELLFSIYGDIQKKEFFANSFFCDPGGIRTHDPQLRRLLLYPAELRDHRIIAPQR